MSDPPSSPTERLKGGKDISDSRNDPGSKRNIDVSCSNKSVNISAKKPESDPDDARLLMNFVNILMNPGGLDSLKKEMGSEERFKSFMFGKGTRDDTKAIDPSGKEGCFTRKIFDILDKNRDGYVTKSELELTLASCNSKNLSHDTFSGIYDKLDPKKSGKICYEDFDKSLREMQKNR